MQDPALNLYFAKYYASTGNSPSSAYNKFASQQVSANLQQLVPYGINQNNFQSSDVVNLLNNVPSVGQLSWPNISWPAFSLGISNPMTPNLPQPLPTNTNDSGEINPQQADWLSCYTLGLGCDNVPLGGLASNFSLYMREIFLALLALVLVAFGLYFLGKSTDTGQAVINVAKKL